jgi:biotin operon repressor
MKGYNKKEYQALVSETRRLYEVEGLSLGAISARLGISRQAVHQRLVNAGVEMRPAGQRPRTLPREPLERLYVQDGKGSPEIAAELGVTSNLVLNSLRRHGIAVRTPRQIRPERFPELGPLKIGESLTLPRPVCRGKWQSYFYHAATKRGIKISVIAVGDTKVKVTRLA